MQEPGNVPTKGIEWFAIVVQSYVEIKYESLLENPSIPVFLNVISSSSHCCWLFHWRCLLSSALRPNSSSSFKEFRNWIVASSTDSVEWKCAELHFRAIVEYLLHINYFWHCAWEENVSFVTFSSGEAYLWNPCGLLTVTITCEQATDCIMSIYITTSCFIISYII